MEVVYVAGPYSGVDYNEIEANIRRAEAAAIELWEAGFGVFCPHLNTEHFEVKAKDVPQEAYLECDLLILPACTALLLLGGWAESKGALGEAYRARELGIPIFYSIEAIKRWREEKD